MVDVGVVLGLLLVDQDGGDDDGGEGNVEPAAKRGQKARGARQLAFLHLFKPSSREEGEGREGGTYVIFLQRSVASVKRDVGRGWAISLLGSSVFALLPSARPCPPANPPLNLNSES